MALSLACLEIGLKQAPHAGWFSAVCLGLFVAERCRRQPVFVIRTLQGRASGRRTVDLQGSVFRDRLRVELLPRRRPVRLGLSDAGFSRLSSAITMRCEIGAIMLVTGVAQLVDRADRGALESRLDPRC